MAALLVWRIVFRNQDIQMGNAHKHSSGERRDPKSVFRLKISLLLTATYMVTEVIGGYLSNSLALLADAGHMLTDVAALTLTLTAIWFGARPATAEKTYGYYRLEILAAFINGIALALISIFVIIEAFKRLQSAEKVEGFQMTLVAFGGLLVNMCCAFLLSGGKKTDLNMRSAWLHVMGDALGSIAAITAGLAIFFYGWFWADAVSSVVISIIIIYGSWNIIKEAVHVLLEGTPSHINLAAVEEAISRSNGVVGIHDLHVWTIASGVDALSVHVRHSNEVSGHDVLKNVRTILHDRFGIDHLTIQTESDEFELHFGQICEAGHGHENISGN